MPDTLRTVPVGIEDHLTGERQAGIHHDCVGGERSTAAGASRAHDRHPPDLASRIALYLGGEPYRVASPDVIDGLRRDGDAR